MSAGRQVSKKATAEPEPRRRRRSGRLVWLAALALIIWLPMAAWAPAAGAVTVSWPGPSLSGLRSWLAGPGPAARLPRQGSGQATGSSHQVSAAVTRVGRGRGRPAGKGRGQLPAYHPHAAQARKTTSPPDRKAGGFSRKSSKLMKSATTSTSDLYKNPNGTMTRFVYSSPVNYQDGSGNYLPIQAGLVAATGGGWRERANSLSVRFASHANGSGLMSVGLGPDPRSA